MRMFGRFTWLEVAVQEEVGAVPAYVYVAL